MVYQLRFLHLHHHHRHHHQDYRFQENPQNSLTLNFALDRTLFSIIFFFFSDFFQVSQTQQES
uniref:Uncharacterized protein MANES_05G039400 n=1 Tax=Rhizophora mucronata TaxID=61149 RepID=A0A2P2JJA6_RHIMU